MERYEAYKDSGIEWISDIPADWTCANLGAIARQRKNPNKNGEVDNVLSLSYGSIRRRVMDNTGLLPESFNTYNVIEDGDVVLRLTDLQNDQRSLRVGLCHEQGIITSAYTTLEPQSIDSRYLFYSLAVFDYWKGFYGLAGGVRQSLTFDGIRSLRFPLPSRIEQQAIADYLDAKTTEIDALVADCEREVGLLREYRKAVISEAVTKGLDPDAPMKDSGIEWIGKSPTSWEYLKLGYTFDRLFDIDHWMPESVNEGYPYLMIGDLEELASRIDFESCKHISEEDYLGLAVKGTPKRGDVIIARYATIGTGCFVDIDEPFIVTYACLTVTPKRESMRGRYLLYYTQSDAFERELFMLTNSNTQGNVGKDSLSKAHILLPPIDEQDEIVSALDASIGKIDKLIETKQSMADKLREYRRSLISEAVTGKFKVPGV